MLRIMKFMKNTICKKIKECRHDWWRRRTITKIGREEEGMVGRGEETTDGDLLLVYFFRLCFILSMIHWLIDCFSSGAAKNGSGFRFLWKKYLTDTGQKLHSSFSTATSGVITLSVGSLFSWGLYKLNNKVYDVTSIFKKNEFWNDKLAILSKLPTTLSELQSDVLSLKRDVLLLQALAGLQSSKQVKSHSDVESCKRSLRALIAERQCAPIVLLLA